MQRFQRAGPAVNSPEQDSRAVVNSEESDAGLWTNSAELNLEFSPEQFGLQPGSSMLPKLDPRSEHHNGDHGQCGHVG
jgi:hypothetical protein